MITAITILSIICATCTFPVFEFAPDADMSDWLVVDDGVMGGRSQGSLTLNEEGIGVYTGFVSLENNGGFSSIRFRPAQQELVNCSTAVLRVKGDEKRYQFRIKSSSRDRVSYIHYFETTGEWEDIEIPLADCTPSFRGMQLDMPNYPMETFGELGILIANKKNEDFRLEIQNISFK